MAVPVDGTVTVGGSPLAGVAFAATNNGSCSSSNAAGQYVCNVPQVWTGSITPSLSGYTFTPASRNYTNLKWGLGGQDFTATSTGSTGTVFYIHTDHLNTPRVITNQVGQAVWRYDNNDPFGGNVPNENPSGLGTFTCNLRLPGQYFDKETNLHYNYFRDYDPGTGRYVQSDPIGLDGGINTYLYVKARPTYATDIFGLWICGTPASPLSLFVPDVLVTPMPFPSVVSFIGACQWHDRCYDDCVTSKGDCDRGFYQRMFQTCARALSPTCFLVAEYYYDTVDKLGAPAFNSARSKCKGCAKQ